MAAALAWGVKQSFRSYVTGSGGSVRADAGAAEADDGFVFAADGGDLAFDGEGRPRGTGRFRGALAFQAHGGLLSVSFSDPWVEAGPDGCVLSVADAGGRRVPFAKLDAAGAAVAADGAVTLPCAITLDGMMILGDHYPPGTVLDPVTVRI
ncbi:MAG: HtaA domain-containing protein [Phenylobacterium sp.]|uniref:HtaA domain-containing protein n=1 Tax=Phenylobacterium sp. TaxID=1871053 RepID=UPI001A3CBA3D|nr:HtaA domain-containing protein [Phenylobacterium sp.]MBL8773490.1 HtaA domain-containing protein [Phenylobacterium sp.]